MEQKTALKKLTASTKIVGIVWIAFALSAFFFKEEIGKTIFILLPHIMFFVMFLSGILLSGIFYLKKLKYDNEKTKLADGFSNKKDWEQSQYELHQQERDYREKLDKQQFQLKQREKDFEEEKQNQIFYLLASGLKLKKEQSPDEIKKNWEEIKKGYESFKSLMDKFNKSE
jgi:hypothetical protein